MIGRLASFLAPRHRTEAIFTAGLAAAGVAGIWALAELSGTESWRALGNWFRVLDGEVVPKMKTPQYVRGGLTLTAILWIAIPLLLLATRRAWCFDSPAAPEKDGRRPFPRRFALGLALIVLLAAGLRWPRLDLSLYNDEADAFRSVIAGSFDGRSFEEMERNGLGAFRRAKWSDTFWNNRLGNNHALFSVLARLGYDTWKRAAGGVDGQVREWPLRLPPLLGGLASIVLVGLLGAEISGRHRTGLLAAVFLALHPWHLRFSTEARGYGLFFAFAALTLLCLIRAVRGGRWSWWFGFALAETGCLWSYLGSLYFLVALNVAALALMTAETLRNGSGLDRVWSRTQQGWVSSNLIGAMLSLLAIAPLLPLLTLSVTTNPTFHAGVPPSLSRNILIYSALGMPWHDEDATNPYNPALEKWSTDPLTLAALTLVAVLFFAGWWWMWRRSPERFGARLAAIVPLAAFGLQFAAGEFKGAVFFSWYASFLSVFAALTLAMGVEALVFRGKKSPPPPERAVSRRRRFVVYGLVALFAAGTARTTARYRAVSKQALKPAVVEIRGGTYPFSEAQMKPMVIGWWTGANLYDPYLRVSHQLDHFQSLIARARREDRPFYYVVGMKGAARAENPALMDFVEHSGVFRILREFPGLEEEQFRTTIFELKAAEAAGNTPEKNP
ncbi:MAG: glycosyltransferase family 39 protein [Akkermansiaceae bacterium]|nr:glycosyltransferase family 39 protein [Akkermansiaceae bacterium]